MNYDPQEAHYEQRLHDLIGRARGALTADDNRRARAAVSSIMCAIRQAGYNGIGITTLLDDVRKRGLHRQSWWQTLENIGGIPPRGRTKLSLRRAG